MTTQDWTAQDGHTMSEVWDRMDRALALHERAVARVIARMRAQGQEPASLEGRWSAGYMGFSFTLRWPTAGSDAGEFHLWVNHPGRKRGVNVWGCLYPRPGVAVSGRAMLAFLSEHWATLARDYAAAPTPYDRDARVVLPFAHGIGRPDLPRVDFVLQGPGITIETARFAWSYRVESAVVVMTLLSLGNVLAERLRALGAPGDAALADAWTRAAAATDLLPAHFEVTPEGEQDWDTDGRVDVEAAYFARRLGYDLEAYKRAAVWLHARQTLYGTTRAVPEPTCAEWRAAELRAPADLPDEATVMALAARAAAAVDEEVSAFVRTAVATFNADSFHTVLYVRWPERFVPEAA